jgi:hypothetical protein
MFTLCHELRSRMRGGRPDLAAAAKSGDRSAAAVRAAEAVEVRKRRRFIEGESELERSGDM